MTGFFTEVLNTYTYTGTRTRALKLFSEHAEILLVNPHLLVHFSVMMVYDGILCLDKVIHVCTHSF